MTTTLDKPIRNPKSAVRTAREPFPGQWTQPCPQCDGTLTAADITVGLWRLVQGEYGAWRERLVKMTCPHCGHRESRTQQREV